MDVAYECQEALFWDWNSAIELGIVFFQQPGLLLFLTVNFCFWQYACKLSKQLCRPVRVSDIGIRSST